MSLQQTGSSARARICIDLGTAYSKASVFLGDDLPASSAVAPLPIGAASGAEHPLLAPSAMYVADNHILFGPSALRSASKSGEAKRNPILSFKMILSAREIEPTLALKLSRSVDPTSTLTHGDALVLYLAYIDQLVRAAIAAEPLLPADAADSPRRLTSPLWRANTDIGRTVGRLIEEASVVSAELGPAFAVSHTVPMSKALEALQRARAAPAKGNFEGIVFEAHSAASAYAAFARAKADHLLVIDIGAGTTDFAGFESNGDGRTLSEITEARQWCALAGDEIDNIVMELFMRASGGGGMDAKGHLWRALRLAAQDLKREIFVKGKAVFEHGPRRITVRREALMNDASFKAFGRALAHAIAESLKPVAERAKRAGSRRIKVLLAGGGSALPFLADLLKGCTTTTGLTLEVEPFGTNWALPYQHHPLSGAFPQLAISMGGALAAIEPAYAPQTV